MSKMKSQILWNAKQLKRILNMLDIVKHFSMAVSVEIFEIALPMKNLVELTVSSR